MQVVYAKAISVYGKHCVLKGWPRISETYELLSYMYVVEIDASK